MPEQESIHHLQTEIQTLKIKDEFRTKELDALMKKLSDTSSKLNELSENIGRLLAGQELHKTSDNEVRDELKILHTRIGDLHDKCTEMIDKTETRVSSDISLLYKKIFKVWCNYRCRASTQGRGFRNFRCKRTW